MRRLAGLGPTCAAAVVAAGIGAVVLAGCGSGSDTDAGGATTTSAPATTTSATIPGSGTTAGAAGDSFAVLAGEGVPVDLDELAGNLRDRLVAADHVDATVEVAGDRVEVTPGLGPLDDAALDDLLSTPGRLEVRPVLEVLPPDCEVVAPTGGPEVAVYPQLDTEGTVVTCYSLDPSGLTNDAVEDANATFSATSPDGSWVVNPVFTEAGLDAFNALATECYSATATCPTGRVAFAVDGVVLTAPIVNEPTFERDQIQISGGSGQDPSTGTFTEAEARVLAAALRVEPLPSGLEVVR